MLAMALFCCGLVSADELSAEEQQVWDLENAYWEYVKSNDIPGYRSLWDERFIGWPGFSHTPLGKENIHGWIAQYHANPAETYDYKLSGPVVRQFGDVVVAHYLVEDMMRSAETGEIVSSAPPDRVTHTWQRRGDTWQIITGMSAMLITDRDDQ
jgi:ketosteroid isomerase-like protein